ncbi:MAG: tyrosine-type recombinase/integrase [Rhodospirillaceae bacterium]|nr:tyrosine-type recombinase/integrase [Rhodospirillaceae bacterium]
MKKRISREVAREAVEKAVADGMTVEVYDTEVTGLMFVASAKGNGSWKVRYRTRTGRRRVPKIGSWPAMKVERARRDARDMLTAVMRGEDPSGDRQAKRQAETVSEAVELWFSEVEGGLKPRTLSQYRRMMTKIWMPALGTTPVATVERRDVERVHRGMKQTPREANHALAVLSSFMTWARRDKRIERNPVEDVSRHRAAPRKERFLDDDEVRRLWQVLDSWENGGRRVTAVRAIRFLLLTGLRHSEALALQWDNIDFHLSLLRLTDTKTGPQDRPVASEVLVMVTDWPREGAWVFPGKTSDKPLVGLQKAWEAIRSEADLDNVRIHDLRHSFASTLAKKGEPLLIIGKSLGHRNAATTQRYAHIHRDEVMATVGRGAGHILAVATGRSGEVLQGEFPKKRKVSN